MRIFNILLILLFISNNSFSQNRDSVFIKTDIYEIIYSETKEQPLWIRYDVEHRPKKVDRKGFDFYVNDSIHTSDDQDYSDNVYDKGHLAPALHFTNSYNELYLSFSYLNCALQHSNLNRGQWKVLESQERKWAKNQLIIVTIELVFSDTNLEGENNVLLTGATIPTYFLKTIYFVEDKVYRSFYFPNTALNMKWKDYEIEVLK